VRGESLRHRLTTSSQLLVRGDNFLNPIMEVMGVATPIRSGAAYCSFSSILVPQIVSRHISSET
jgi:hypothetical protein